MTFYKVSYHDGRRLYEELFLEREFAFEFLRSLKRSRDLIQYAVLDAVIIRADVLTSEQIDSFGV